MKTIGLIANLEKPRAAEAVRHVAALASDMGFIVLIEERTASLHPDVPAYPVGEFKKRKVEAVVVLGGDGTLLDAAHKVAEQHLPLMGLNIGSLGYLTSVEEHQFAEALQQLRENRYAVSRRSALAAAVHHQDGTRGLLSDALNDVVVYRGESGHAVELDLLLDRQPVSRFLCDGLIVATPTGSTAYSLSAGGPIVLPGTPALVISLICPHTLTSRPLVVCETSHIAVKVVSDRVPVIVSSDGRDQQPVRCGDAVEIVRSCHSVPLIELHGYNPCDVLRRKLRWGGR
ncbi:MAG: NAD(+)/NADH kinase [Kiritimatiellia bacterium]|jgi:NAD+ kinase|nr:NAD(+)/NADH kinase [Kiritimatiellia bacterium]